MDKYSKSNAYLKNYFFDIKNSLDEVNNKLLIKRLNTIIDQINNGLLITDLDFINEIETVLNRVDDNKFYETFYGICLYNENIQNKKVITIKPILDKNIDFENIKLDIKDILNYLKVDINDLDEGLAYDLSKYIKEEKNIQKLKEFANFINDISNPQYKLFGKISDNNLLVSILIHTSIENVKAVIDQFKDENGVYNINYINKIIYSIPQVFVAQNNVNNHKYDVPLGYSNFMANINLFKDNGILLKNVINHIIIFNNSSIKNSENFKKILDSGLDLNSLLKYTGNILTIKPDVVFNNIKLLNYYNIPLTNDDNNNGYTILGMSDLDKKIDYLLETGEWSLNKGQTHDNIDLIRALIIKDDYLKWKNNYKCDILNTVPNLFQNKVLDDESISNIYDTYDFLHFLDLNYLSDDCYQIDGTKVSKRRLLKNLNNINSKNLSHEEILREAFMYGSNLDSEVVSNILSKLEMGDNSVKLSKGI